MTGKFFILYFNATALTLCCPLWDDACVIYDQI